jgi:hypothetical protein
MPTFQVVSASPLQRILIILITLVLDRTICLFDDL